MKGKNIREKKGEENDPCFLIFDRNLSLNQLKIYELKWPNKFGK